MDVKPKDFSNLVPLVSLKADSQTDLARKSDIQIVRAGTAIFNVGDTVEHAIYVLDGDVVLQDSDGKPLGTISGGTTASQHRLAHQSPRRVSAKAKTEAKILYVDARLLDVMLTWDQTGTFEVKELVADEQATDGDDWMTRLLQMRTFQLVPPSNLQAMFMRMTEVAVDPGTEVIKQDDDGDYFYVVTQGRFMVTREHSGQKPVHLAELDVGSCFGEEALISDAKRNATITSLTKGKLMRLSKQDFQSLLNAPIARKIEMKEASALVDKGEAVWLDVRLPSEYQADSIPGSINLPLYMLRPKLASLDKNKTYITVCDSGRRSSVAVFILMQKGYKAYSLESSASPS